MIQFSVLSGKKAGSQTVVRHFPFCVGRTAQNDWQIEDDGVWGSHLTFELNRDNKRITVTVAPDAVAAINDQTIRNAPVRNGDIISFGSVKMQIRLAGVRQRGLLLYEWLIWLMLAAVTATQFLVIYWLFR